MIVKSLEFKNININNVKKFLDTHPKTQLFSAKCFKGKKHILHCVNECLKTFASGRNISKSMQMEFLLFLTGTRQIKKAIKEVEVSKNSIFVAWGDNAEKDYRELKRNFDFKIKKLPKVNKEEELRAIEKSSLLVLKM